MSAIERGVFTLSLDLELIWGTLDLFGPERFRAACQAEREIVGRLVDLFAQYSVPATWYVLGHLLLDHCAPVGGRKHPEIVRPSHRWVTGDWFEHDPGGCEKTQPVFFGRSLLERIRACPVPQEIGAHSFSHVIFGDPGCSRETADSELTACMATASENGLRPRSFAFPRNSIGHLDILSQHGFTTFRGPGPRWYESGPRRAPARLAHVFDVLRAAPPPTVQPYRTPEGLICVPGSMVYLPRHGVRRWVPVFLRVLRARKGLSAAAQRKQVFHLWLHPTNLVDEDGAMLRGLERILACAARLRERGEIDVASVSAVADGL